MGFKNFEKSNTLKNCCDIQVKQENKENRENLIKSQKNLIKNQPYFCIRMFIYIYFLLKPYYFFSSGSIQPSDFCMVIAFFLTVVPIIKLLWIKIDKKKNQSSKEKILKYGKKLITNDNICWLTYFSISVVVISIIYSALYFRLDFVKSALFYIFNYMAVYVMYYLIHDKKMLDCIRKILVFNLIIQLFIYIFKIGKWYGIIRYMGTFNDPNQFAFYIFSSQIAIFILEKLKKKSTNILIHSICFFLIYQSGSTGMLMGEILFISFEFIFKIKNMIKNFDVYKFITIAMFTIPIFIIVVIIFVSSRGQKNFKLNFDDSIVYMRLKDKVERADCNSQGNLFQERGYDKITKYPYKIIMGAGHGYNERYKTYHTGELHATFPSILFYYGIMPLCFLLKWIIENVKNASKSIKYAYFAVFIESFTLINQRQFLFWFIIMLGDLCNEEQSNKGIGSNTIL